jgi:carboxypeptidase D
VRWRSIFRASGSAIVRTVLFRSRTALIAATAYIGWDVIQSEVGVLDFVRTHPSVFGFSAAFLAKLAAMAMKCGYATYAAKHVTYPPKGPLPLPGSDVEFDDGCDVWSMVEAQATLNNPAFNIYRVYDVVRSRFRG